VPRASFAAALAVAAIPFAATDCGSPQTPPAPPPEPPRLAARAEIAVPDPARDLEALLAAHPPGDAPTRSDLLAVTETHSFHLVQTRRAIVPHYHRGHRERATVLAGSGTVVIADRTYPAVPGALFRMDPGVVHAAYPEEGAVLVALVCYEPPMEDRDADRVVVPVGDGPGEASDGGGSPPAAR